MTNSNSMHDADHKTETVRAGRRVAALMRHGHFPRPENTASAHLALSLSDEGREQSEAAADVLLGFASANGLVIDPYVESSPLLRAYETATVVVDALKRRTDTAFDITNRDELIERGLGSCANLRFDEIESLLARDPRIGPLPSGWWRIPDFQLPVPGAESLRMAGERTAARIDESLASIDLNEPTSRLRLFVAHAGCLRHAAFVRGVLSLENAVNVSMEFAQIVLFEINSDGQWVQLAGNWKKRITAAQDPKSKAPIDRANQEPAL
jgi:broad specificity phosphatase PhoE